MALSLPDKPLSFTGAATGIGEAIARRLANAGAAVAVADLNLDAPPKSRGPSAARHFHSKSISRAPRPSTPPSPR